MRRGLGLFRQVYVNTIDGEQLGFLHMVTVGDVKVEIQKEKGIPPCQQRLVYNGDDMEDGRTLESYGIAESSNPLDHKYIPDLVVRSKRATIAYLVKFPNGSMVSFHKDATLKGERKDVRTIADLKTRISEGLAPSTDCDCCGQSTQTFEGVPVALQRLSYKGQVCKDTAQFHIDFPETHATGTTPQSGIFFDLEILPAFSSVAYVVCFCDGSTHRFGGFNKKCATISQLAECVATGRGRIDDGSVFRSLGHPSRLTCCGMICDETILCESFRVSGSSSSGDGAAAAADIAFVVVSCPPASITCCGASFIVTHPTRSYTPPSDPLLLPLNVQALLSPTLPSLKNLAACNVPSSHS
jgi:hypothetical protein